MGKSFFSLGFPKRKLYGFISGLFRRSIEYLTFVHQPLKKKFILFGIGVLAWLLIISAISMSSLFWLGRESGRTLEYLIPQDRASQKIIRKLQMLKIDGNELAAASGMDRITNISSASNMRIEDIRSFIFAMGQGGTLNDIDRENDKLIESFRIEPAQGADLGFVRNMSGLMDGVKAGLDKISGIKMGSLNGGSNGGLEQALAGYDKAISSAVAMSNEYSHGISGSYTDSARHIKSCIPRVLTALSAALAVAILLLILFTFTISNSIIIPIKAVIGQIRALNRGEIDASKRIKVAYEDEIGRLASEFNGLIESMDSISNFKKVIEEDEDLADVYSRLGTEFKYYGFDDFTIYEVANSQNKMKPVYPVAMAETACNPDIFENCFLCRAKKTGHVISSLSYPNICKYFLQGGEREHICVPMMIEGTAGGVVQFSFDKSGMSGLHKEAIEGWVNTARRYIKESIPVIETKRLMATLRDSALKDALTGLHNRRFLQECAESLVAGAMRRGKNIGLIMGDLDFFKQVNDIYGHNTGDAVLKETAQILKKSVRAADLVIRFGGEEFLIVLMDVAPGESAGIAEKIRDKIENTKFKVADGILKKTISLGISEFPADTEGFWQCIKFADVALYEAKNTGRNKVVRFAKEMWKDEQF